MCSVFQVKKKYIYKIGEDVTNGLKIFFKSFIKRKLYSHKPLFWGEIVILINKAIK